MSGSEEVVIKNQRSDNLGASTGILESAKVSEPTFPVTVSITCKELEDHLVKESDFVSLVYY